MAHSSQDGEIVPDDGWSSMHNRVNSFQHFPRSEEFPAERLARAGFYFTGQAVRVHCFSCHATVEDWNRGDTPLNRHQQASPDCTFLNCAHSLKTSDFIQSPVYNKEAEAREFQLRTGEVVDQTIYPKVPHMKSEEARLNTFSDWPADAPVQPEDLAAAGMYYLRTDDMVRSFCCGHQLAGWEPGDDAWGEHAKIYPNCFFILGHGVGNVPLPTHRPRVNGQRASVETFEGRLDSFRGRQLPIDPERLARAGFHSTVEMEEVFGSRRGGNINKELLKREAFWIHKLKSLNPNGMNEELDLSVFL
uniref:RING-type E3 ubiquitin transferase n=1 Tax=Sinocyclocheilus anshuiensis TaxID=1608454 RepID=A0A671MVW2_9TELE